MTQLADYFLASFKFLIITVLRLIINCDLLRYAKRKEEKTHKNEHLFYINAD